MVILLPSNTNVLRSVLSIHIGAVMQAQASQEKMMSSTFIPGKTIFVHVDMVEWTMKPIPDKDGFVQVVVERVRPASECKIPAYHADKDLVLCVEVVRVTSGYHRELTFWTKEGFRSEEYQP